ncbi:MAG TPA: deoxyribonuclease IV [Elusimicrobiota bacterium]|nr:deoxyribonuclease IV [Elusimicrobiota bacterium]
MILGIHASVARGLVRALEEADVLGCAALQILPYRRHHPPSVEELAAFRAARAKSGVRVLLVHSRFAPSLASSDPARRVRSVEHLAEELRLCSALGGEAYVLHAGAYSPGSDADSGIKLFAGSVRGAVEASSFPGTVLLENVPGGGRRMGGSLEELARLLDAVRPGVRSLGACLDTAHAWAEGYDLSSAEAALEFVSRAHRLLGADAVRAFHLNDTGALLGSHREHHWHWGKGRLGLEGLKVLLAREEFADVPGILETPKEPGADAANLAVARAL